MWYTPYLVQPQGSYSFGRTPSLGCQASGPWVPSDGCEMLARARERERERVSADDELGAVAAPRHPPTPSKVATGSNFGLLGQFCPQTTTSPPTLSDGLLQLAALALLGMSGFVPISPNGSLAMTGGRSRLRLVRLTLPNLPNHPDNPGWPQIPCSY